MIHELLERTAKTPSISSAHEPIGTHDADAHRRALAELRALLEGRELRTRLLEWVKLTLTTGSHPDDASSKLHRYPPEFLVFGPQGRRVASVRIASRSSAYMVDVVQVSEDDAALPDRRYVIPVGEAAKAAALIPGHLSDAS